MQIYLREEQLRLRRYISGLVCWWALVLGAASQQYVFHAYRQAEGLKDLAINALAFDRGGFLWVATENGLFRFLGSGFDRFGLEQGLDSLNIYDVISDPDGTLWVATDHNLFRWNGVRFEAAGGQAVPIDGAMRVAVEDSHHLLVITQGHLYRLKHDSTQQMQSFLPVFRAQDLQRMPQLGLLRSVHVSRQHDGTHRIWLGCGGGLCSLPSGDYHDPAHPEQITYWGVSNGLAVDNWRSVLVDHNGTLWAAARHHVAVLEPGQSRFVDRSLYETDPGDIYSHAPILEDHDGRVLVPAEEGVARWEKDHWRMIGRAAGLSRTSHIMTMIFDASGDLWLGGHGDGLYNWLGYNDWEAWGMEQNLPSAATWTVTPVNRHLVLVGSNNGPGWLDPLRNMAGPLAAPGQWRYGQIIAMDQNSDGSDWALTYSGYLTNIAAKTGKVSVDTHVDANFYGALSGPDGHLFMFARGGLYERKGRKAPVTRVEAADPLIHDWPKVNAGCTDYRGRTWFLGNNQLLLSEKGNWSKPEIDGLPKHLPDLMLSLACAPDGSLWAAGIQTGVWHFVWAGKNLRAAGIPLPKRYSELAPLALLLDRRGWIWLGTDDGLLVWNGDKWRHLTEESGLIWNDIDQGAMAIDGDGTLWIGTSSGLAHELHPERAFDSVEIRAAVTQIERGNKVLPVGVPLSLPWSEQPLHLRLSASGTRNHSELHYRYRMQGMHDNWIEDEDNDGVLSFSALPPGRYNFEATAINEDLDAQYQMLTLEIEIQPPWWRTRWFYALCLLFLLLALSGLDRLRARALQRRSLLLEELVHERTRELESSQEQLRLQASHDSLTGMLNRMGVLRALNAEIERARREKRLFAVALIDLDHFKRVNDTYGHMAGDDALRWFAAAVGRAIRPYDHAGRYGGEEFLLVLTDIDPATFEARIAALHAAITNLTVESREATFSFTTSLGATLFDSSVPVSGEQMLMAADEALYHAKAGGRNRAYLHVRGRMTAVHATDPPEAFDI